MTHEPADADRKGADRVLTVFVERVVQEQGAALCEVFGETMTGEGVAAWRTRPVPELRARFDIWRYPSGEIYAVGADGDRHQVHEMTLGRDPRRGNDPVPFPPAPDELVQEATELAESLGLRLQFRRTCIVVHSARGAVKQPFIESWQNTLELVGLGDD